MRKLTHKEFLERLIEKNEGYRNGEFEVVGEYTTSRKPLLVKNKYGKCLVNTKNLLNSAKPTIETAVDKDKYCINQFKDVHGEKYKYPKLKYKGSKSKVEIVCKEHGVFKQDPHAHLSGQGCYECVRYSRLDGRRLTTQSFVKRANKTHKGLYLYKKVKVDGSKNKVVITCKVHGDFEQSPNSHLKGRGCKQCYLENNGYNKGKFVYFAKGNICTLYLIRCHNKKEEFLKIGITSKSIKERFSGSKKLPYCYEIIFETWIKNPEYIWKKEVELKKKFKEYKYRPKIKFRGYTECFMKEGKENIINYIKSI